jgi:hypothetical protein
LATGSPKRKAIHLFRLGVRWLVPSPKLLKTSIANRDGCHPNDGFDLRIAVELFADEEQTVPNAYEVPVLPVGETHCEKDEDEGHRHRQLG